MTGGARTHDVRDHNPVLCRLSYGHRKEPPGRRTTAAEEQLTANPDTGQPRCGCAGRGGATGTPRSTKEEDVDRGMAGGE